MSDKKILLLSGPAKCGKNSLLQEYLSQYEYSRDTAVYDASCKVHLYKLVQDFFLVSEERFWEIYNDRELKEKPMPEFRITLMPVDYKALEKIVGSLTIAGCNLVYSLNRPNEPVHINLSIRSAMIYVSEIVIKPRMGLNYFGRARMLEISKTVKEFSRKYGANDCIFYDDSSASFNGRSDELVGLVDYFGEDNILLINIQGRGKFGVGDSRNYHADGTVKHTVDLWNTGTEKEFLDKGCKIIQDFLNRGS